MLPGTGGGLLGHLHPLSAESSLSRCKAGGEQAGLGGQGPRLPLLSTPHALDQRKPNVKPHLLGSETQVSAEGGWKGLGSTHGSGLGKQIQNRTKL